MSSRAWVDLSDILVLADIFGTIVFLFLLRSWFGDLRLTADFVNRALLFILCLTVICFVLIFAVIVVLLFIVPTVLGMSVLLCVLSRLFARPRLPVNEWRKGTARFTQLGKPSTMGHRLDRGHP
jgi:hypothetical protein